MNIVTAITDTFDAIGAWLVGAVGDMVPMFYDASTGLTFLGTLALIGLGISVSFLLIGIVQRFLKLGA